MAHPQNRGQRNNFKNNLQIDDTDSGKYYAYKSHGSPCSCWACRGEKFKRNKKHKNNIENDL
jgi:hypothetical protein